MNKTQRKERLLPNGKPKYIRVYESKKPVADPYTIVFSGNFAGRNSRCYVLGMSSRPRHPLGICIVSDYDFIIDEPSYKHLGRKINFDDLPEQCRESTLEYYNQFWRL